MKYIDADKLKAEINGIIKAITTNGHPDVLGTEAECMAAAENEALNLVLETIDSLQQEQPEVDLEKEYKEYVEDDPVFSKLVNHFAGMVIARHFYELGLNARKEE